MTNIKEDFIDTANLMTGCFAIGTLAGISAIAFSAYIQSPMIGAIGIAMTSCYGYGLQWLVRDNINYHRNNRTNNIQQPR